MLHYHFSEHIWEIDSGDDSYIEATEACSFYTSIIIILMCGQLMNKKEKAQS